MYLHDENFSRKELELSDIIAIDVIASELFNVSKFNPKELVKCALVCKKWHMITRKVLQKKVNCSISLILKERREGSNLEKIRWLQNCCSRNFFNTIKIVLPQGSPHKCQHNYQNLVTAIKSAPFLQTNFYGIEIDDDFTHQPHCQALQVIKLICQILSSSSIEDLIVRNQNFDSVFRGKISGKYLFQNARYIKIRGMPAIQPDYRRLLRGYPYLKKIIAGVTMSSLTPFVSLGKTNLVSILSLVDLENLDFQVLQRFAEQSPKLKAIIIHPCYIWFDPAMENIFNLLLASSQESLETISTTLPVLGALTAASSCPLVGVQQIDLNYLAGNFETDALNFIATSNIFQNLTTVEFTIDGILPILDDAEYNENFNRLEDCTCSSVKNVIFLRFDQGKEEMDGYSLELDVIREVAQVFPSVRKFSYKGMVFPISGYEFRQTCFGIWGTGWESLETIEIGAEYTDLISFDAVMLGISNAERAYWLELLRTGVNLEEMQYASQCRSMRDCPKLCEILVCSDASEGNTNESSLTKVLKHKPGWVRLEPIVGC